MPRHALAALAAFALIAAAHAQPASKAKSTKGKAEPAAETTKNQTKVELGSEVFRLENVGLSVNLPIGAQAQKSRLGDQITGQITPGPGEPPWLLTIQTPKSGNAEFGPKKVAEEVLEQIRAQYGITDENGKVVRTEVKVIQPVREVRLPESKSRPKLAPHRFYAQTPGTQKGATLIRGYTVFGIGGGRFVVFDLAVPETSFEKIRPVYEAMIATAEFEDPAMLSQVRGEAIEVGQQLLAGLNTADYEAAIAAMKDEWFRLYKPSTTGADADATELGYIRIRAWTGTRGEVDGGKGPQSSQAGYLVRVEARQMSGEQTVDSAGVYFVSKDRLDELWTLQVAARDTSSKRVLQTMSETGARAGASMSVAIGGSAESRTIQPFVPEQGYLSQAEMFLLPQLLVRAKRGMWNDVPTRELGFYTYQSEFSNIRFRRDAVGVDDRKAGAIKVTTKMNEDRDPFISLFNERGELVRSTLADGTVREPIQLQRLMDLWKSKGLPVD